MGDIDLDCRGSCYLWALFGILDGSKVPYDTARVRRKKKSNTLSQNPGSVTCVRFRGEGVGKLDPQTTFLDNGCARFSLSIGLCVLFAVWGCMYTLEMHPEDRGLECCCWWCRSADPASCVRVSTAE